MGELANALHYIPGAKAIVFFSARTAVPKDLARAFAATNTPVFVVNTQNWMIQGGVRQKYLWTEHPLKDFAEASGGRYFSDVTAVQTVASDIQTFSANYYVLGYYVNLEWDGKAHRIEVQVTRPGMRVFVQEGYSNPKPFAEWSDIEKKLQIYDLAFADRPDVPGRPRTSPSGRLSLRTEKGGTGSSWRASPSTKRPECRPGRRKSSSSFSKRADRPSGRCGRRWISRSWPGRTICPYVSIPLSAGEYEVRFVARDPATGQAAAGAAAFNVPAAEGKGVRFNTPLSHRYGARAELFEIELAGTRRRTVDPRRFLSLPSEERRAARRTAPGRGENASGGPDGRVPSAGAAAPKVSLDFRLTNATGDEFPIATRIVESKKIGATRSALAIEIDLPDLAPGDYTLEITATDAATKAAHVMRSPFSVI